MEKYFCCIYLPFAFADYLQAVNKTLHNKPVAAWEPERGRKIIRHVSREAYFGGVTPGMVVADAQVIMEGLELVEYVAATEKRIYRRWGEKCLRFSPEVSLDIQGCIMLQASGCWHLWGSEQDYVQAVNDDLQQNGFYGRVAMAETPGAAYAFAVYGQRYTLIAAGDVKKAIATLPVRALRIGNEALKMQSLGLNTIESIMNLPHNVLRRRFGSDTVERLKQTLGTQVETLTYIQEPKVYNHTLEPLEPVTSRYGIEEAIRLLLKEVLGQLENDDCGLKKAQLVCVQGNKSKQTIEVGTCAATCNVTHVNSLFALEIEKIMPGWGIEKFTLTAKMVEKLNHSQHMIWQENGVYEKDSINKLLDTVSAKVGSANVCQYIPAEHYWPERAYRQTAPGGAIPEPAQWVNKTRPVILLTDPAEVKVTVPVPDYPPMLFIYKGCVHKITCADGPERIEQEWWLSDGDHRDYYVLEDEAGRRYWVYRSGHYDSFDSRWYLHGFFA